MIIQNDAFGPLTTLYERHDRSLLQRLTSTLNLSSPFPISGVSIFEIISSKSCSDSHELIAFE